MPQTLDIAEIAAKYDGLTGSDISNAILNAAFRAARKRETSVPSEYFYAAVEDILHSKAANQEREPKTTVRPVSEAYVKEQLSKGKVENPSKMMGEGV